MTAWVAISRGGRHATALLPWGVYLGGVQVERCATLAEAKVFARQRYGIAYWCCERAGFYRGHIDDMAGAP